MSWTSWHGDALLSAVNFQIDKAVEDASQAIKGQALQEVPHDEGTLSQSIQVFKGDVAGERVISAGGGAGTGFPRVPYALRWHEETANFQKGRKNKYIRDPLLNTGSRALIKALENRLRKLL